MKLSDIMVHYSEIIWHNGTLQWDYLTSWYTMMRLSDIMVHHWEIAWQMCPPSCSSPCVFWCWQPSWWGGTDPQEDQEPCPSSSESSGSCFLWQSVLGPHHGSHEGLHLLYAHMITSVLCNIIVDCKLICIPFFQLLQTW